jgi:hypothetical protein
MWREGGAGEALVDMKSIIPNRCPAIRVSMALDQISKIVEEVAPTTLARIVRNYIDNGAPAESDLTVDVRTD